MAGACSFPVADPAYGCLTEGDRALTTTSRTPLLLVVLTLAALPLFAEDGTSVTTAQPDPSAPQAFQQEDFSWSVGMGFVGSPRPYKGTDAKLFPVPVLNLRYKRAFFQGIRGGFDLVQGQKLMPWNR